MKENDLIQVLWVEDDPKVTKAYPLKAETFGLELVASSCWDDAKAKLEGDYNRWAAIILDAKCKQHRDSVDNAVRFLGEALKDIASLSKEKKRIIPWYVLTGGAESEVSDSITDDRMKWDADWTDSSKKKYYSKDTDTEALYSRIKDHANKSPRIQIQEMYRKNYEQLLLLNKDVCEDILTILEAIHFPDSHPDFNPRLYYNPLRKALEYVFRLTQPVSIIPDVFFKDGIVNLNQCFMFLIGREAEKLGYKHRDGGITPRHIQDMMSLIINLGNANSHSFVPSHATELSEEEIQLFDNHIKTIGGKGNEHSNNYREPGQNLDQQRDGLRYGGRGNAHPGFAYAVRAGAQRERFGGAAGVSSRKRGVHGGMEQNVAKERGRTMGQRRLRRNGNG